VLESNTGQNHLGFPAENIPPFVERAVSEKKGVFL
jgi:hypothetical protein